MLDIEQWDLEIQHIKGILNTLADILSRNPHVYKSQCYKPKTAHKISVHAINFKFDSSVKGQFKNLGTLRNIDTRLHSIR